MPFALTLAEGLVVGLVEDVSSNESLSTAGCSVRIAVAEVTLSNKDTDAEPDPLVAESHLESATMKDVLIKFFPRRP